MLSYSLALFLKKEIKGVKTLRLLFYLPVLIPSIAFGQVWLDMLAYSSNSAGGIINQMLTNLNLGKLTFYSAENTQFITFLVTSQWGIGGGMIIWLAALKNISTEIYEAAEIDGANAFVKLFKLTIPMTTPIIFITLSARLSGACRCSTVTLTSGEESTARWISSRSEFTARRFPERATNTDSPARWHGFCSCSSPVL